MTGATLFELQENLKRLTLSTMAGSWRRIYGRPKKVAPAMTSFCSD